MSRFRQVPAKLQSVPNSLAQPTPAAAEPRDAHPVLQISNLGVSFDTGTGGRLRAVDGVSLSIYPRQTLAVVGESGCGKSVTAMSVLQLIPRPPGRIDSGSILFRSRRGGDAAEIDLVTLNETGIRRVRGNEIAMIFQEPMTSLNPVYTVGDQIVEAIRFHQRVAAKQAEATAIAAMREVGIAEPERRIRQYPHQFSGGMRQRIMIAMALACRPDLLIADEPTTALDVTIQAQILDLLRDLRSSRGMAIMLITHALGVVAENADVVCVMYAGRVVEYATVPDLFDMPLHPYTRGLLASIPRLGERRARLTSIQEIVSDPAEFLKLDGAERGVRPWWPGHKPPADLAPRPGPAGDSLLHEASPGHWVGVWRIEAFEGVQDRPPDLAFRGTDPPG